MSEQRPSHVLGALPNSRPHRRSAKRDPRQPGEGAGTTGPKLAGPGATEQAGAGAKPKPGAGAKPKPAAAKKTRAAARAKAKPKPTAAKKPKPTAAAAAKKPKPAAGGKPGSKRHATVTNPPQRSLPPSPGPSTPGGPEILVTAVQAAAELAEMGLSASARAIRAAISRMPRP